MSQNFLYLPPLCEKFDIELMSRNWKFWLRSFKLHARAYNIMDDGRKVALLLDRAGRHAQTLFYAIAGPNADEKTFDETIASFDAKFERKPNLLHERCLFSAMQQQKGESAAQFELRLREKAQTFMNSVTLTELVGLFLTNLFLICSTSSSSTNSLKQRT